MVYNTQNYWVFGICPSSGLQLIRRKEKHDVSETGNLERANLNHWTSD
jgi:hypothetical protein